jgi:hypothetical protein
MPVPGAEARVEGEKTRFRAGAGGRFVIESPGRGTTAVLVVAAGFREAHVSAPAGVDDVDLGRIELCALLGVRGTVVDGLGGPVAGATVLAVRASRSGWGWTTDHPTDLTETRSGPDGGFRLDLEVDEALEGLAAAVIAHHADGRSGAVLFRPASDVEVVVTLDEASCELVLVPGEWPPDRTDESIRIEITRFFTDPDRRRAPGPTGFTIEVPLGPGDAGGRTVPLPAGSYGLEGRSPGLRWLGTNDDRWPQLPPGERRVVRVSPRRRERRALAVRARVERDGRPFALPGVKLRLVDPPTGRVFAAGHTGLDGAARLTARLPEHVDHATAEWSLPGLVPGRREVKLPPGDVDLTLALDARPDLPEDALRLRLVDASGEDLDADVVAFVGATGGGAARPVHLWRSVAEGVTHFIPGEDLRAAAKRPDTAAGELVLRRPGLAVRWARLQEAVARVGAAGALELVLAPAGTLRIRVSGENEQPVPGARVRLWGRGSVVGLGAHPAEQTRRTDERGLAELTLSTRDAPTIILVDRPDRGSWATVLAAPVPSSLEARLPTRRLRVTGRLVCEAWSLLSRADVALWPTDTPWPAGFPFPLRPGARAAPDGTFAVDDVPANLLYRLSAAGSIPRVKSYRGTLDRVSPEEARDLEVLLRERTD